MKKLAWLLISPPIATPLCAADLMQVYRDAQSNDPTFTAARATFEAGQEKQPHVGDRPATAAAFDKVAARHGRIDTVFANAGIDPGPGFMTPVGERNPDGAIENIPDSQWDRGIEINLTSVYTTVKNAVRHMKPNGGGEIIVTSSIAAH